MIRSFLCALLVLLLAGCAPFSPPPTETPTLPPTPTQTDTPIPPTGTPTLVPSLTPTAGPPSPVPDFDHIVIIMFENREFGRVIGNAQMPNYNALARQYTLLTQYYAVTHPSLPNYIALMGGDTFGITSDCRSCFVDAQSLPDLIEASGRTWKTYQEDMPKPCHLGDTDVYVQNHNPFIYFNPIRLDAARCERSIVPLTELAADIQAGSLPDFIFITPNLCNDAHDCGLGIADAWLKSLLDRLVPALEAQSQSYLVIAMFEEGQGDHSCCGLPKKAGGRVPVVFLSPLVKTGFEDATPYTHYSLLRTISLAWGLPLLGKAADDSNVPIVAPWK